MLLILGWLGSLLMGMVLGLVGGGGSILTVPILVYLMEVKPVLATSYSLFVVGTTALIGTLLYIREKLVDYRMGMVFATPAFLGVFLVRRFGIPAIPEELGTFGSVVFSRDMLVMVVFAAIMILASVSMLRKSKTNTVSGTQKFNYPLIAGEGLLVGGVTGFVGAGGGFLIIPALVVLARLPMKVAVGTSLMIIAVKSLFGFVGDLGAQEIQWGFLALFSGLAAVGLLLGVRLSRKIPGEQLQPAFGWFVMVMGIAILIRETVF